MSEQLLKAAIILTTVAIVTFGLMAGATVATIYGGACR